MPTVSAQIFDSYKSIILEKSTFMGFSTETSLLEDQTALVFKQLMIWRKDSEEHRAQPVYDIKVYPEAYFSSFNPSRSFTKWAAVLQKDTMQVEELQSYVVDKGLYLCFTCEGRVSAQFFQELYSSWLPQSEYELDDRPHFDKLWPDPAQRGAVLKEEIYIPVK